MCLYTSPVSSRILATLCVICSLVSIIGIVLTSIDIHPLSRRTSAGERVFAARVGLVWDHDVGPVNETRYRAMTVAERRTFAAYRKMTISFQQTEADNTTRQYLDMLVQYRSSLRKYLFINYRLHTWKDEKSFGGEENPSFNFSTCRRHTRPSYTCDEVDEIPCLATEFQAVHDDFCLAQYVNRHIQPIACAIQLETVVSTYALLKAAWAVRLTGFCVTLIITVVLGCLLEVTGSENLKEKPWIGGLTLFVILLIFQFPGMVMALMANGRLDGLLTKTDMCPSQTQTLQELGWENRLSYGLTCTVLVTVCCFVPIMVYLVFSLCNSWRRARNTDLSSAHPSMATPMNSSEEMQPAGGGAGDDGVSQAEVQRLKTQVQKLQADNRQLRTNDTKLRGRIDELTRGPQVAYGPPSASRPTFKV